MRVGVIRGDLPGPLFMADLEPSSQINFPTDPAGQTRYVSRPSVTNLQTYLNAQGFGAVAASTVISTCLPVGGPLDVSTGTVTGIAGLGSASATQVKGIADLIAPHFVETDVAVKSFEVGNLAGYLLSSYVPDPHRLPAMTPGAAITVVQDDGVSAYSAPKPSISGAVHNSPNAGDLTITGVGLANPEQDRTIVDVTNPTTGAKVKLYQKTIRTTVSGGTTGSVTATSIVIPASLLAGLSVVGNKVQVQYTSLVTSVFTIT